MLESGKRVFFQTRVDEGLLGKFRDIQEREGRTARSLIEDYFYQLVEEDDKRKERELGRQDGRGNGILQGVSCTQHN